MGYFELYAAYPLAFAFACGFLGLLIGSFLNVVIYRLPVMMEREWHEQCVEFLEEEAAAKAGKEAGTEPSPLLATKASEAEAAEKRASEKNAFEKKERRFDLMFPSSHCPNCQHNIRAWENIPLISYLLLGRKCRQCDEKISIRYPFVELLTGVLSFVVAWHFGYSEQAAAGLLFTWLLIALSFIDYDTQLLPDVITIPMVWIGLLLSLGVVFVSPTESIIGAVAGYLALWSVYQVFKLLTGKEGMGFGDFKLLSAMGAWLGWKMLPVMILLSSFAGAVIGIALIVLKLQNKEKPIPFGPYLAIAGWLTMLYGNEIMDYYFQVAVI